MPGGLLVCSLSVCQSVRQSVHDTSVFQTFLCCLLRNWLQIWYMTLSWHNTDQVRVSSGLTYFYMSYCSLLEFSFLDFSLQSFEILTSNLIYEYVIIHIKFEFRHTWPTFTGVIALFYNFIFQTFLCSLLRYWLQIWYMNLSWHNTDQVRVLSLLTYFYRSYCPLLKFSFPDFSLQSFEILNSILVYELVLI